MVRKGEVKEEWRESQHKDILSSKTLTGCLTLRVLLGKLQECEESHLSWEQVYLQRSFSIGYKSLQGFWKCTLDICKNVQKSKKLELP
jgi:hypothetical protein